MAEKRTNKLRRRKAWKRKNHEPPIPTFPFVPPRGRQEMLKRDLGHLEKAFAAGNKGALLDAVVLCLENRLQFPDWLGLGVIDAIKENLIATRAGRKWVRRFKQDMIDFMRAEEVIRGREEGLHWNEAYSLATLSLRGTIAAGSEDSIHKSYQRFKKNNRQEAYRYKVLTCVQLQETVPSDRQRREFWECLEMIRPYLRASGE